MQNLIDMLTAGAEELTRLTGMAMLLVLLAMMIDLAHGVFRAFQNGEARRSYALKRTGGKFLLYEGSLAISYFIDRLLHASHLWQLIGLDGLSEVPMVTFLVAIFYLVVEFMSVREKADQKQHSELKRAEEAVAKLADAVGEKILDAVADKIADKIKPKE